MVSNHDWKQFTPFLRHFQVLTDSGQHTVIFRGLIRPFSAGKPILCIRIQQFFSLRLFWNVSAPLYPRCMQISKNSSAELLRMKAPRPEAAAGGRAGQVGNAAVRFRPLTRVRTGICAARRLCTGMEMR